MYSLSFLCLFTPANTQRETPVQRDLYMRTWVYIHTVRCAVGALSIFKRDLRGESSSAVPLCNTSLSEVNEGTDQSLSLFLFPFSPPRFLSFSLSQEELRVCKERWRVSVDRLRREKAVLQEENAALKEELSVAHAAQASNVARRSLLGPCTEADASVCLCLRGISPFRSVN